MSQASRRAAIAAAVMVMVLAAGGCRTGAPPAPASSPAPGEAGAPRPGGPEAPAPAPTRADRVVVQHILISVGGKLPGRPMRSPEEARVVAYELLARARDGESFDDLVKAHSDDAAPGIYALANHGVMPGAPGEFPRSGMVRGFGNLAFALVPGEIGMCDFDPQASPWGFHIIKRLR